MNRPRLLRSRSAASLRTRSRMPLGVAAVLAVAVALGACSPTGGSLGTLPPSESSPPPSVAPGSPDITPDPSDGPTAEPTTEPTSEPSRSPVTGSPTATPGPTSTPSTETSIVRIYLYLTDDAGEPGLVPVLREIPKTSAIATAALEQLLAGPDARERADGPLTTAVPARTRLLGLTIRDGVATVDLSREFESGGGSESVVGRLAQVVYTLTQFPTVQSVRFELDGQPVTVFGGEGVILDGPVSRDDYLEQLPEIFVDRPAWGAAGGEPIRVTGLTRVFEATFRIRLSDADGDVLADQMAMATCGTGCWGTFDVSIPYGVSRAQWGTLRVYANSAQDGAPIDIRDYPVWLTPSR